MKTTCYNIDNEREVNKMYYYRSTITGQCYETVFTLDHLKGYEPITKSEYLEYAHRHYN